MSDWSPRCVICGAYFIKGGCACATRENESVFVRVDVSKRRDTWFRDYPDLKTWIDKNSQRLAEITGIPAYLLLPPEVPMTFTKPTKVAELQKGDVVRLVGGLWSALPHEKHKALATVYTPNEVHWRGALVEVHGEKGYHVDDASWPFEFVSRPDRGVTPAAVVIIHEEPIVLIGGVASPAAVKEAADRATSAVKRKCREWPWGKTLDGEVRGDKLCVFWVDE